MTYQEMMERVNANRTNSRPVPISRAWNYEEPYKMIIIESQESDDVHFNVTVAFKVENKIVERTFLFSKEGKASYFWEEFFSSAFPNVEETTWDQIYGRPFAAKIIKNGAYDNLKVLSGYKGEFPEEPEGLA